MAFARLEPNPNIGEMPTVVPATLSAGALEVLMATKLDTARRLFKEQIDTPTREAGRSSQRMDAAVMFRPSTIDGVFTGKFRNFDFPTRSLNMEPEQIKNTSSLCDFATPAIESVEYKSRQDRDIKYHGQLEVEEERTKMEPNRWRSIAEER